MSALSDSSILAPQLLKPERHQQAPCLCFSSSQIACPATKLTQLEPTQSKATPIAAMHTQIHGYIHEEANQNIEILDWGK